MPPPRPHDGTADAKPEEPRGARQDDGLEAGGRPEAHNAITDTPRGARQNGVNTKTDVPRGAIRGATGHVKIKNLEHYTNAPTVHSRQQRLLLSYKR